MIMNIFRVTNRTFYRVGLLPFDRLWPLVKSITFKNKNTIIIGVIPVIPSLSSQSSSVKEENNVNVTNTKNYNNKDDMPIQSGTSDDEKTPWERVRAIFEADEFGNLSKELVTTLHSCYLAMAVGFLYGGVQKSRIAFIDFMERNQASIFENHIDAKRKLQNHVTIHFGKGAFQWGWRMTAFTGSFMLLFFSLHAYRGTSSIIDYAASGAVIGALMRIKLGPPGIIIGGTLGGILGLFCGLGNRTMLNFYGASLDDILEVQYKIDTDRDRIMEEMRAHEFEKSGQETKIAIDMLKDHEDKGKDI